MHIGEPMKNINVGFTVVYKIKKYIFRCAGPLIPRDPRPGPRGARA